jgi:hypothetical protein
MPSDVELLIQAGFSNEDVENWAAARRAALSTAGFSDHEIDDHLGAVHVPSEIPKPFLDRLAQGTAAAGRILGKFKEGFGDAFGEDPLGLSGDDLLWLSRHGIFRDPDTGRGGPLRFMNEALLYPSAQVLDIAWRSPGALLAGTATSFGQALEESGMSHADAMSAVRDLHAAGIAASTVLGADVPVPRPTLSPLRTSVDQPIGALPRSQDFRIAAKDIAGDAADLSTQKKLLEAWTDRGIHPAEIAEDAQHDPTIAQATVSKDVDFPTAYLERRIDEPATAVEVAATKSEPAATSAADTTGGTAAAPTEVELTAAPKPEELPATERVGTTKERGPVSPEGNAPAQHAASAQPALSGPEDPPAPSDLAPETASSSVLIKNNVGPRRARLVAAGLDHLAAQMDNPEVQAKLADAIKRGTAKDMGDGIGFVSQSAFETVFGPAGDGYDWHHIVNKHRANMETFGPFYIHNTSNFIRLPELEHGAISAYYSKSKNKAIKGFTVRNWLKSESFDSQHTEGIKIVLTFFDPKSPSKP